MGYRWTTSLTTCNTKANYLYIPLESKRIQYLFNDNSDGELYFLDKALFIIEASEFDEIDTYLEAIKFNLL